MEILEFREAVRKRPGMYFGDTNDGSGAKNLICEVVANGVDLFLAGLVTKVDVVVDGRDVSVTDDGPGLPFDRPSKNCPGLNEAQEYLEKPHFSPSAKGHAPHIHFGVLHGLGLAVVNAISDTLDVHSDNGQNFWRASYQAGLRTGDAEIGPSSGRPGTCINLVIGPQLAPPDVKVLKAFLESQTFLFPELKLSLNGETFYNAQGLLDLGMQEFQTLNIAEQNPKTIWHRENYQKFRLNVALIGDATDNHVERSWVNGVETKLHGSHMDGLNNALERLGWRPAAKLLHIIMEEPKFAGPTKDELNAPHIVGLVERAMNSVLKTEAQSSKT